MCYLFIVKQKIQEITFNFNAFFSLYMINSLVRWIRIKHNVHYGAIHVCVYLDLFIMLFPYTFWSNISCHQKKKTLFQINLNWKISQISYVTFCPHIALKCVYFHQFMSIYVYCKFNACHASDLNIW